MRLLKWPDVTLVLLYILVDPAPMPLDYLVYPNDEFEVGAIFWLIFPSFVYLVFGGEIFVYYNALIFIACAEFLVFVKVLVVDCTVFPEIFEAPYTVPLVVVLLSLWENRFFFWVDSEMVW